MNTIEERITALLPRLQKYAAAHASALSADDLLQIASEEILLHCKADDNDTYMLRLANWRMANANSKERRGYLVRVDERSVESDPDEDDPEDNILEIIDLTGTPEEILITNQASIALREAIRNTNEFYTRILEMLAEGMSQHEIARALNTSQPRIRYHILKIRKEFRQAGLTPDFA